MTRHTEGPGDRVSIAFREAALSPPASGRGKRRYPPPFSLRLTADERAKLEQAAGDTPLATYIKFRLFNGLSDLSSYRPRPGGPPATDTKLIAQLLAALGEARLANNLNQLAKAANTGSLPVTPETEAALQAACRDVQSMRAALVEALGLKTEGPR